ncbi:ribosome maturation protein RimP [Sphingomonas jatrophae]|uniref:ribosome maturation protein RimP n=1 Tax=Sphingomonas jatrophae TaxID=1166337 RepID=UPI000B8A591C|nr:ribosome maturation protein RimP [Sphingomonas jatrophae]
MADIAALERLIEPEAQALGLSLVRVAMFGGKSDPTLQVMAERPDTRQLDIADCEALSRRISDVLDEHDPIEEAYRLEVSSPGIDRPLTRSQDYADWAGFDARVKLSETIEGRKQIDGKLLGLADGTVTMQIRAKDKSLQPFAFPLAFVASAKLLLTDELIRATAPLDAAGAEEEEIEDAMLDAEGVDQELEEGQD